MKKIKRLSLLIIGVTCLSSFIMTPAGSNMVVIVNNDNPVSTLTAGEVKLFYTRRLKSKWPGNDKNIKPATRKSKCTERDAFYAEILKMDETQVEGYFSERQFQKGEATPNEFFSDSEIIDFVSREVGAISFVNASSLTAEAKSKVKVVLEF